MKFQDQKKDQRYLTIENVKDQVTGDFLKNGIIYLPSPTQELDVIFSQLKIFSKQRLDTGQHHTHGYSTSQQQIKGLKFISSKLARLFIKNRRLPYNEISKILIDNFASEQKDQRNIKRRVYDAINVLVAAGILIKKNNYIEMVKERIRTKIEVERKEKLEDEVRGRENVVMKKKCQNQKLVHKHKLIKKLFERNFRQHSQTNRQGVRRTQINLANSLKKIIEPRIFILFDTENNSPNSPLSTSPYPSILQTYKSQQHIQVLLPYHNNPPQKQKKNLSQQNNRMQIEQNEENSQQNNPITVELKNGTYSLLQLLEFLTLNYQQEQMQ